MRLPSLPSLGMSGKDWSLSSFKDALPKLNVSMPVLPSMDMSALQALGNQAAEAAQDKSSRLQAGMQARIDNMTSSIKDGVNQQRASLSGAGSPAGSTTSGSASEQAAAWSASAGLDASPPSSPSPSSSPLAGAASVSVSLAQELGSTLGWAAAALGEILTGPPVATTPDAAAAKLAHQAAQYERVTAAAAAAAADDTDAAYAASGSPARGVRGGSSGSSMGWRDTDSTTVEYGMRASGQKAPANWREAAVSNGSTAAAKSSASSGSNSNSHARAAALSYVSSSAEPSPPPVSPSSAGAASAAAYGSPTAAAALPWAAPASQAAAAAPRSQPQQAAPATAASSPSDRSSSPSDRSYSPGRGTWREELNRLKQDRAELAQSITRTNQAFGAGSSSWQDPSAGNNTQGPQSGADGGSFSMRGVPANVRSSWRALVDEEEAYTVAASLSSMRRGSAGGGGLGAASVRVYADDAGDGFEEEVEVVQVRR